MTADGVYPDMLEETYHADRRSLSVSGAKLLLPPSCPAKFQYRMTHPQKPKREFEFGHLAHEMLLGKGPGFVVLNPAVHGLKKDGGVADSPRATATWKKAEAEAREAGRVPVHVDDFTAASLMAKRVRAHGQAGPLFEAGVAEQSLFWTDPESGVQLRGRVDWLTPSGDCVDYKTSITVNPDELVRRFWQLRYFMQADWYRSLLIALGISDNPDFLFVVQEKDPPHLVEVVRYDADALAEGHRLNRLAIDTYRMCRDADDWPGYGRGVVTLSLPGWAFTEARAEAAEADLEAAEQLITELEGIYT